MAGKNPYTKGYFENREGSHYSAYEDWPQFKQRAEWIFKTYHPKTVFEIGAAKGFLLRHLAKLGVEAKGIDMSGYAAGKSDGRVRAEDFTDHPIDLSKYDLVVSFDLLEHIAEENLPLAFINLATAKQQFHMVTSTEYDFGSDTTHFSSHPKQWWLDKFEEAGIKNYKIIHAGEQELFE